MDGVYVTCVTDVDKGQSHVVTHGTLIRIVLLM